MALEKVVRLFQYAESGSRSPFNDCFFNGFCRRYFISGARDDMMKPWNGALAIEVHEGDRW